MSDSKIGTAAEVATAFAAVTYPIARLARGNVDRRRARAARSYARPAAAVEARLVERCVALEARLALVEHQLDRAA